MCLTLVITNKISLRALQFQFCLSLESLCNKAKYKFINKPLSSQHQSQALLHMAQNICNYFVRTCYGTGEETKGGGPRMSQEP